MTPFRQHCYERDSRILDLALAGYCQREIAERVGCSQQTVSIVIRAAERMTGERLPRHAGRARDAAARAARMRSALAELGSIRAVADVYGLSRDRVHRILKRAPKGPGAKR